MVVVWRKHWFWSKYVTAVPADPKSLEAGSNYMRDVKGMQHSSPVLKK
jgi:hypothetical protein